MCDWFKMTNNNEIALNKNESPLKYETGRDLLFSLKVDFSLQNVCLISAYNPTPKKNLRYSMFKNFLFFYKFSFFFCLIQKSVSSVLLKTDTYNYLELNFEKNIFKFSFVVILCILKK